jgi:hypothetical protein
MRTITTVRGLINYIGENSGWSSTTIRNVITSLGYSPNGGLESLKELSSRLCDCSKHGADSGFCGFIFYHDTLKFFQRNRADIVGNLKLIAQKTGEDIIKMVQYFGVFRYDTPPTAADIDRAIWGAGKLKDDLTILYNAFAWFCLEEISRTWYRHLEDNPAYYAELSA